MRGHSICDRLVTDITGEPVETTLKVFWPGPGLPEVAERWAERFKPDVFFMRCSAFWCSYESVPLRLQRRVPLVGRMMGNVGLKAGGSRFAENRAFQGGRQLAVRTIGGDVHFGADEVTATVEETFRRVMKHESVVLALCGPGFARDASGSRKGLRRAQARNSACDEALLAMCQRLRIPYHQHSNEHAPHELGADIFHTNEAGQRTQGEAEGKLIAKAWLAAHGAAG